MNFDDFWVRYPRKIDRKRAFTLFDKIVAAGTPPETIIRGLEIALQEWEGKKVEFIPHAITWLRGERWNDEPTASSSQPSPVETYGCPFLQKLLDAGLSTQKLRGWFINVRFTKLKTQTAIYVHTAFVMKYINQHFELVLDRAFGRGHWMVLLSTQSDSAHGAP